MPKDPGPDDLFAKAVFERVLGAHFGDRWWDDNTQPCQVAYEASQGTARVGRLLADVEKKIRTLELADERAAAAARGERVRVERARAAEAEAKGIEAERRLRDELRPKLLANAERLDAMFAELEPLLLEHRQLTVAAVDAYEHLRRSPHGGPWPNRRLDRGKQSVENRMNRAAQIAQSGRAANLSPWERTSSLRALVDNATAPFNNETERSDEQP